MMKLYYARKYLIEWTFSNCHRIGFLIFCFISVSLKCSALSAPANQKITPKRIQSILFDKGEPHRIYLVPGLGTVIVFPCFVSDGFIGDESQATVRFSPTTKRNLLLSLKSTAVHATNLIVRCENQSSHFVFDIIPNRQTHQDVLEINSSFGRPEFITHLIMKEDLNPQENREALIPGKKRLVVTEPQLVSQSGKGSSILESSPSESTKRNSKTKSK